MGEARRKGKLKNAKLEFDIAKDGAELENKLNHNADMTKVYAEKMGNASALDAFSSDALGKLNNLEKDLRLLLGIHENMLNSNKKDTKNLSPNLVLLDPM